MSNNPTQQISISVSVSDTTTTETGTKDVVEPGSYQHFVMANLQTMVPGSKMSFEQITGNSVLQALLQPLWETELQRRDSERKIVEANEAAALQARKELEGRQQLNLEVEAFRRELMKERGLAPVTSKDELLEGIDAAKAKAEDALKAKMRELGRKLGHLVPALAFFDWRIAVTFRGWLAFWTMNLPRKWNMDDQGQPPEFHQAMRRRNGKLKAYFEASNEVITAWGLDYTVAKTTEVDFTQLRDQLEVKDSPYNWLILPPVYETATEKAAREAAKRQQAIEAAAEQDKASSNGVETKKDKVYGFQGHKSKNAAKPAANVSNKEKKRLAKAAAAKAGR